MAKGPDDDVEHPVEADNQNEPCGTNTDTNSKSRHQSACGDRQKRQPTHQQRRHRRSGEDRLDQDGPDGTGGLQTCIVGLATLMHPPSPWRRMWPA